MVRSLPAVLLCVLFGRAAFCQGPGVDGGQDASDQTTARSILWAQNPDAMEQELSDMDENRTAFVADGKAVSVREEGANWQQGDGYIQCSGVNNILYAGRLVGEGDFHLQAELTISKLSRSAATFCIEGNSHFGFEGGEPRMFVQGPLFGNKTEFIGEPGDFLEEGKPFKFEVIRQGDQVSILIDGKTAHEFTDARKEFGMVGFRPWRSTMRISEFSVVGETSKLHPPRTQPTNYTIPTINLTFEKQRQVIVERIAGQYLGHPTTVLLADDKTILVTYPLGHGGPSAVLKKSTDGGLTWGERLPVPDNWATATNCPCLHRLTGPDGIERLLVLEGNGPMRQSVSVDNGETWTPFEHNGLHCVVAPITIVPISGERYLAHYHRGQGDRDRSPLSVWQSISEDGGLTWGPEREVGEFEGADLCEPALIRSPDGRQLACIMRENRRRYNSMIMFSDDEGETWSKPVETPASLTGDRHMPRYAHDGRLVMCFRDTALGSPTRGDFVAWVGTYDDLANLREGQYRVHLINSPRKFDLGYPGLELLPDGTFAATTYVVLAPDEKNSVVSVRFKLSEIDEKAERLPQQSQLFRRGEHGYHTFRIPSLIRTSRGTLLAFCEARKNSGSDTGDIDLVLRRSFDNGLTWDPMQTVADDGPNTIGNPCPVVDRDTGTIWLLLTGNLGQDHQGEIQAGTAEGSREAYVMTSTDDGATWSGLTNITETTKAQDWTWYATGPGVGIQMRDGRMVIPCDHAVAGTGMCQSHAIYSDDHGESWRLGGTVGDHTDECQIVELQDGVLLMNMRSYHGGHRRAIARSEDGGETWSEITLDDALIEPVCQASLITYSGGEAGGMSRLLFSNPADARREKMTVRVSYDEGNTWPVFGLLHQGPSAYSCLETLADGSIGCLYECGEKDAYEGITFARFGLDWVSGDTDAECDT